MRMYKPPYIQQISSDMKRKRYSRIRYRLLYEDSIEHNGHTLYRVQAMRQCTECYIMPGTLGGYIESYTNLSQRGSSWVGGNAKVYGNARVEGRSTVLDNVEVCDNAIITDRAVVLDSVLVCGNSRIGGDVRLSGNKRIVDKQYPSEPIDYQM